MYVCTLDPQSLPTDHITLWFLNHRFVAAVYLIFAAMLFDALDGRLARLTRHTTDFGGQLDSMSDMISFGAAPAFLALQVFKDEILRHSPAFPPVVSRLVWAFGAMYLACAAVRLARFNVSNEHGEQHHFSFLGLPSPGAGAVVAALVLMQQELARQAETAVASPSLASIYLALSHICTWAMPLVLLGAGLLMVSNIRYPHLVNRYLRGRRSLGRLLGVVGLLLGLFVAHQYVIGVGTIAYAIAGIVGSTWRRFRPMSHAAVPASSSSPSSAA